MALATIPIRFSRRPAMQALQLASVLMQARESLVHSRAELRAAEDELDRAKIGTVSVLIAVAQRADSQKADPKDRPGIGKTDRDKDRTIEEALLISDDYQTALARYRKAQTQAELDAATVASHGDVFSAIRLATRERLTAALIGSGVRDLDL